MASGNPAKAKEDQVVEQVRAGIRQGRKPKIPLSDTTSVIIESTNEDEAEFVTRLLLLHEKPLTTEEALMGGLSIYIAAFAGTPEWHKYVKRHVKQWLNDMDKIEKAYAKEGIRL